MSFNFLHKSIKRRVKINISGEPKNNFDKLKLKSVQTWKDFYEKDYSWIIVNFYSQLLSITSCCKCEYITSNHEPILVIPLTLKEEYNSIYDCLNEFTQKEVLDKKNKWKCDNCNEIVQPQKEMKFWDLANVLIFSIKAFRLNAKMEKHIEYPKKLNMKKYCINKGKKHIYDLCGLCIHNGNLNGGHYYSICKDYTENEWRIHNDTHVSSISLEDVLKETPYCLFYSRIEC